MCADVHYSQKLHRFFEAKHRFLTSTFNEILTFHNQEWFQIVIVCVKTIETI